MTHLDASINLSSQSGVPNAPCTSQDEPRPARFWWLKRLSLAGVVALAAGLALRLWWGHVEYTRLLATVEHFRSLGFPTTLADLDAMVPTVPGEDNAALLYEKAANGLIYTPGTVQPDEFLDGKRDFDNDLEAAQQLMNDQSELRRLMREARSRPSVSWSLKPSQRANNPGPSGFSEHRAIAKHLRFAMAYAHHQGDDQEALAFCHDLVAHSEALMASPDLISQLVAWAIDALALDYIENPGAGPLFRKSDHEALSEARTLLNRLASEESIRQGWLQAELAGAATGLWEAGPGGRNSLPKSLAWLFGPSIDAALARRYRESIKAAQAAREPFYVNTMNFLPLEDVPRTLIDVIIAIPAEQMYMKSSRDFYERQLALLFRLIAERRLSATGLAIQLYAAEHGRRPAALAELVPAYLAKIPHDPFCDGKPIRYISSPDGDILYSFGPDLQDNGGIPRDGRDADYDLVFFLDGDPRKKTTEGAGGSEKPSDHKDAVNQKERQDHENKDSGENPQQRKGDRKNRRPAS